MHSVSVHKHEILFNRKHCGAKIANTYTLHITNVITFHSTFTLLYSTTVLTAQKDMLHGYWRYKGTIKYEAPKLIKETNQPNPTEKNNSRPVVHLHYIKNPANFFLYCRCNLLK